MYLERLIYRRGQILSIGVCEEAGCDKLHILMGIASKNGAEIDHGKHGQGNLGFGSVERGQSPFVVPISVRLVESTRKGLLEQLTQIREMKALAARAEPYDILSVSNYAAWNVMREQDDVLLKKIAEFISEYEKALSSLTGAEKDEKEGKLNAVDRGYFRSMIRDILEAREKEGILVQRGKVIGEVTPEESAS